MLQTEQVELKQPSSFLKVAWIPILALHLYGGDLDTSISPSDVMWFCPARMAPRYHLRCFFLPAFYTTAPVQGDQNVYESKYLPDWYAMYAPKSCEGKDLFDGCGSWSFTVYLFHMDHQSLDKDLLEPVLNLCLGDLFPAKQLWGHSKDLNQTPYLEAKFIAKYR